MTAMNDLDYFFNPKIVAVIGASHEKGKIGNTIMENFTHPEFKGRVFPVNPNSKEIFKRKCFASVKDIPYDVDLAVIAVPATAIKSVMIDCMQKKVKAAVIITSGFSEIGNKNLEEQIKTMAQIGRIRIIGPNCLGIFDSHSRVDTLFLPEEKLGRPRKGRVSFITQSGAVGSVILDWMSSKGYGVSKLISYGNAMDVNENDLLEYLAEDPNTKVICMYMEGVKDGKRFMKVANRVSKKKPVIILKGGRTEEGSRAASSHTGSLAGSDAVYDAVFKQTGLIRVRSMTQMFNFARILSEQPTPRNERIAIVTNGGGFGVLATDEVVLKKMKLAHFSEQTNASLSKIIPSYARVNNPLDLVGDADDMKYKQALDILEHDPNVDVILCIILFQTVGVTPKVVDYIIDFARKKKKPIAVCSAGGEYTSKRAKKLEEHDVPVFDTPSAAVDAIDALVDYSNIRKSRKWTYD